MTHDEAMLLGAAEKYVLRELPDEQRDAYEEHFCDCTECAADIKAAMIFADTSREVFAEANEQPFTSKNQARSRGGWFDWFRNVAAVPVAAGLLLFIGYQNIVTIPNAKTQSKEQSAAVSATSVGQSVDQPVDQVEAFAKSFTIREQTRGGSRGDEGNGNEAIQTAPSATGNLADVKVRALESFGLDFDFTPTQTLGSYVGELIDGAGKRVLQIAIPGELTNKEVHVTVPGGLVKAGKYSLIIHGQTALQNGAAQEAPVARLTFFVEIIS